jgi:hypothetical protein
MMPLRAVMSSNPGSDLMKVPSPAMMIFELCPRTLYFTKELMAMESWVAYPLA